MLPYIHFDFIHFGPALINVWGLFVSLGIITALLFARRLANKYLLSGDVVVDLAIWALVGAFIMARLFHVFFYEPVFYLLNPARIIMFWQGGASSLGGFFGAGLGVWLFAKKRNFSFKEFAPYLDIMSLSLWLGWGIGRIGCFLTHQHMGVQSNFFLAAQTPGGPRLAISLLESLLGFLLFGIFYFLFKKLIKIRWGLVFIFSFLSYAVSRFLLDFLRAQADMPGGDARYYFLTPAQWGMLALFLGLTSALVLGKVRRKKNAGEVAYPAKRNPAAPEGRLRG